MVGKPQMKMKLKPQMSQIAQMKKKKMNPQISQIHTDSKEGVVA